MKIHVELLDILRFTYTNGDFENTENLFHMFIICISI